MTPDDLPAAQTIDAEIRRLVATRPGGSLCPSEVARSLRPSDWRPLMEPVRESARRLAKGGEIAITQGGHPVDPDDLRGPIRLAMGPTSSCPSI